MNICYQCNREYYVIPARQKNSKFCSINCKASYQSIYCTGDKNHNYGKKWTEENKKRQSMIVSSKVDDEYRFNSGKANRGKKFSIERIKRMHDHRTSDSYSHLHNENTKIQIGIKSKEKFTRSFKEKFRSTMEESGHWIPLDCKKDYEIYFRQSNWTKRMFDELYDTNKFLIETYGIFNSVNNTTGVVRDHAFSRQSGFKMGVFPQILRHIENCKIILHSDNVKKHISKNINSDSLTLEELVDNIKNTKYLWEEQEICLKLIEKYENGNRWNRKEALV